MIHVFQMEELKKAAEAEFQQICEVAKQEVNRSKCHFAHCQKIILVYMQVLHTVTVMQCFFLRADCPAGTDACGHDAEEPG